jgi:hypothetical protein
MVSEDYAASIYRVKSQDGGRKVLRNVGVLPHHYTASRPGRHGLFKIPSV